MSTRERWTIYPLLFLALGVGLRSKITSTFDIGLLTSRVVKGSQAVITPMVQCEDLMIIGRDNKPRIRLGRTALDTGRIELYGRDGSLLAALSANPDGTCGTLTLLTSDGKPRLNLFADHPAGVVETLNAAGEIQVLLHSSQDGGLVTTIDPQTQAHRRNGATAGRGRRLCPEQERPTIQGAVRAAEPHGAERMVRSTTGKGSHAASESASRCEAAGLAARREIATRRYRPDWRRRFMASQRCVRSLERGSLAAADGASCCETPSPAAAFSPGAALSAGTALLPGGVPVPPLGGPNRRSR